MIQCRMSKNKICIRCKIEKPKNSEFFFRDSNKASGFGAWCRECHLDYRRGRIAKKCHVKAIQPDHKYCNFCNKEKLISDFRIKGQIGRASCRERV